MLPANDAELNVVDVPTLSTNPPSAEVPAVYVVPSTGLAGAVAVEVLITI